tara:strand:- start:347 stop:649 length:303 start_codon:yes stop_codon:yes gene_type:complete
MARKGQTVRFESDGIISDKTVAYTAEEESAADIVDKEWADGASARTMIKIREKRDVLLSETDWWGASDNTMSDAQTAYRSALRDVPAQADMNNITWPTKP